jgi:hypothetical protein
MGKHMNVEDPLRKRVKRDIISVILFCSVVSKSELSREVFFRRYGWNQNTYTKLILHNGYGMGRI